MLITRHFHHRLMLVRIEWQSHRRDPGNPVLRENLFQFALRRFNTCDQSAELLIFAQFSWNCIDGTRKIVRNAQDVSSKPSCRIIARVLNIFLHPAPNILRFRLGVENLLLGNLQIIFQTIKSLIEAAGFFLNRFRIGFVEEFLRNALAKLGWQVSIRHRELERRASLDRRQHQGEYK